MNRFDGLGWRGRMVSYLPLLIVTLNPMEETVW